MSAGLDLPCKATAAALRRSRARRLLAGAGVTRPLAIAISVAFLIGSATQASGQQRVEPVSAGRAAAQVGAGVLGMPIGFLGGGLATRWVATHLGASTDRASTVALVGAYTGAAVVTAAGPTLVGGGPRAHGSYFAALAGAAVGGAGSVLLVRVNRANDAGSVLRVISFVGVLMLPSVGATVGYNLSRRYR